MSQAGERGGWLIRLTVIAARLFGMPDGLDDIAL